MSEEEYWGFADMDIYFPENPSLTCKCEAKYDYSEGAVKNDLNDDKNMLQLLPPVALERTAEVFTFGAKKYADWNWAKGMKWSRIYGAMQRHLNAWYRGEDKDPQTRKSHLAHAACNILMLIDLEEFRQDLDDRPKHYKNPTI